MKRDLSTLLHVSFAVILLLSSSAQASCLQAASSRESLSIEEITLELPEATPENEREMENERRQAKKSSSIRQQIREARRFAADTHLPPVRTTMLPSCTPKTESRRVLPPVVHPESEEEDFLSKEDIVQLERQALLANYQQKISQEFADYRIWLTRQFAFHQRVMETERRSLLKIEAEKAATEKALARAAAAEMDRELLKEQRKLALNNDYKCVKLKLCRFMNELAKQINADFACRPVSLAATHPEIKKRYRQLSLKIHPDKQGDRFEEEIKNLTAFFTDWAAQL